MLVLSRKKDEKIIIDGKIEITVVSLEGGQVRLGIKAPEDIDIFRGEIYQQIVAENKEAASSSKVDLDLLGQVLQAKESKKSNEE